MATLREVAEYARVSQAVVSRVLNNKPGVWASEETRQRILEAARALRYQPTASAKALSTGRSYQLAISTAVASLQEGRAAELWQLLGFTDAAGAHGYRVILMASPALQPKLAEVESLIRSSACDGFCLYFEQLSAELQALLEHTETPYVVVGDPGDETIPQVDIDNRQYAYESVKWLAKQGHRRIGLVEFADEPSGADRPHHRKLRAGYFSAMHEFCERAEPAWAPTARTSCVEDRIRFVGGDDSPTAVIVPSLRDAVAWEAAFRGEGIRVPEDITILCHVPSMEVGYIEARFAYHAHDLRQMGAQAGELLIRWIETGEPDRRRILIPVEPPQWKEPPLRKAAH